MSHLPVFKRVLLKLSGEALMGDRSFGIDEEVVESIAIELKEVHELGVQTAIVIGGGNIIRGVAASASGIDRVTGDHMGMLGTVINGVALREALIRLDLDCRLMSAIDIPEVAEPFVRAHALRHFSKGRTLIFAAGIGNPFFTTDTCAALRGIELGADILLKATKVDGIYSSDPHTDRNAKRYDQLTFKEAIEQQLKVMDLTAMTMCMEQRLPVMVFEFKVSGNVRRVVEGQRIGTLVTN